MNIRARITLSIVATLVAGISLDGVGAQAAMLNVPPYPTIQAAVDAASPGDTIRVAAGTYDEQVTVTTSNLTITGAGTGTIIMPSPVTANTSSLFSGALIAAIVLVDGATGVTVEDLTVDGSDAAFNACSPGYIGIFYRAGSGAILNTHVTNILHPSALGCQAVLGIFVQSGNGGTRPECERGHRRQHGGQLRQERHHCQRGGHVCQGGRQQGDGTGAYSLG